MGHRFMQQSMKEAVETKGLLSAAINKVGNVVHSAVMGMQELLRSPTLMHMYRRWLITL